MLLRKFLKISSWLLLFPWLLSSCGTSSSVADNNNSLSPAIVIEAAANIPVLDGNSAQTGIYVHNTTDKTISGISYALAETGSTTSLTLNATACNSIEANSSCLLPIATPALTPGNKGSNVIVASYDNTQSKQLVNYSYVSAADYTGVSFSNTSQKLFGGNNYATVYVFAGNHKTIDNVDFTISSASVQISNGLANNKLNLAANTVNALEIHSTANFTDQLVTVTASQSTSQSPNNSRLAPAVTADNSIKNNTLIVTITPSQQANLLMSNVPILTEEAPSAILTVANNGNTDAIINGTLVANTTSVAVAQAAENPCGDGMALAAGATCNYLIVKVNATQNGSAILTLNYNDSLADTSTAQTVYYHNNVAFPAVSAIPDATQLTVPVDVASGTITFNINNYGKGALNTVAIAPKTTLKNTTAAIETNDCGTTLAAGASCSLSVKVTATGVIDSGVVYLNINGSFTDNQGASHSLNFASEPAAITVADTTNPVLSSTIPANNALSVSMATGITLNFSEPMNSLTLNTENIKLIKVSDGVPVDLTFQEVTNNNTTVIFKQTSGTLATDTQYKIVMNPSAVKDANGNAVNSAITSDTQYAVFTTGNTATPTVSSVEPIDGAINQTLNITVKVTFSEEMDPATLSTANIVLREKSTTTNLATDVSYDSATDTATIAHNNFTKGKWYELVLKRANIKDMDGTTMGGSDLLISTFQVDNAAAPAIVATSPANAAISTTYYATADSNAGTISLTFSEPMNTATLTTTNIKLRQTSSTGTLITLSNPVYSNYNQTVTFTTAKLLDSTNYYLMYIPSAIKDVQDNAVSTVTTETQAANFTIRYPSVVISPVNPRLYRGNPYQFRATVSGLNVIVRVTPSVSVTPPGGYNGFSGCTVTPSYCDIRPSGGSSSCTFSVAGSSCGFSNWDTSLPSLFSTTYPWGNLNITTTNNALTFPSSTSSSGQSTPAVIEVNGTVSTPTIYLPQTGQTSTQPATAPSGADGSVRSGIPWAVAPNGGSKVPNPRFVVSGNCVTDNLTGLMWVRDLSTVNSTNSVSFTDSLTKANNGTWCGYSDWRMPNVNELATLINYGVANQADWLNGAGFLNVIPRYYWTSSAYAVSTTNPRVWIFNAASGGINTEDTTKVSFMQLFPVRDDPTPVKGNVAWVPRTGQTPTLPISAPAGTDGALQKGEYWPSPRFATSFDGNCIIDELTGLMWVKDLTTVNGGSEITWSAGLTAISNGTWCGYDDWRMPNVNELRSLVNYGYASQRDWLSYGSGGSSSPNCGLACFYFGNIPSNAHYWTSTLEAGAVGKARVFQNEGSISLTQSTTTGNSRLFPVRGGM